MSEWLGLSPVPSALAAGYYERGWWRQETFLDDLRARARTQADRPVYVNVRRLLGETVTVTFGELADQVERMAAVLRARGVRPGQRVALRLPNWWEAGALWLACGRVGAVAVSLSPSLGTRERDLVTVGTQARLLITTGTGDAGAPTQLIDLDDLLRQAASAVPFSPAERPTVRADDVCQVILTSGSTGQPKGVLHTFNTRYAALHRVVALPEDTVTSCAAPLTHTLGLGINLLSPLVTGRPTVFPDSYDPHAWLDLLERYRVRRFVGTPLCLGELVHAQRRRPRDLSHLYQVVSTGAPLPAPVAADVRVVLCARLINGYGMTEAGALFINSPDDPAGRAEHSLGRPVASVQIRLRATDSPDVSELHVRGPGLCRGMFDLRSRQPIWDPTLDDGWYNTGDLVQTDGHGGLRYLTRAADRIGCARVIPAAEVEGELQDHPAVAQVALIGVPDDDGHEMPCAIVVPHDTAPSLEDLRDFLRARGMTEWYLPARLAIVATLPRTPEGKVRKNHLRQQITAGELVADGDRVTSMRSMVMTSPTCPPAGPKNCGSPPGDRRQHHVRTGTQKPSTTGLLGQD